MTAWWSYALAPFGLAGLWMAGRRNRWGWALGIGTQLLWLAYAVQTRQWGFIPGSLAYGGVYFWNFMGWKNNKNDEPEQVCGALWVTDDDVEQCTMPPGHKNPFHQSNTGCVWPGINLHIGKTE